MEHHSAAVPGTDKPASDIKVRIWSNLDKWLSFVVCKDSDKEWVECQIHIDSTTRCRVVTKNFLLANGEGGGLEVQKSDYQCCDPNHLEQILLQVHESSEENEDFMEFCLVDDERAYAVMTGTEACFAHKTEDGNFAPMIASMPKTKEEKAKQQAKDAEHLAKCAAAEAARRLAVIQAAQNANSNSSTT